MGRERKKYLFWDKNIIHNVFLLLAGIVLSSCNMFNTSNREYDSGDLSNSVNSIQTDIISMDSSENVEYSLSFYSDGGTMVDTLIYNNPLLIKGTELPITLKENFEFVGWYLDEKQVTDYYGILIDDLKLEDNITLSAHWDDMPFVFEVNGQNRAILKDIKYKDLKELYIPHSILLDNNIFNVVEILDKSLSNCVYLKTITIPNSVTSIGDSALLGCSSLEKITLPFVGSSRDATGSSALFGYIFGNSSYTGGVATEQYYSSSSYQTYYIPSSLKEVIITDATNIGYGAFSYCSSLTSIEIPNSVTSIGEDAFGGCSFLQYNEYGNCLYLGNEENPYLVLVKPVNTSITGVTIHNNTRLIMGEAFEYCISLTSIEIPNSVTSIGDSALLGCSSLEKITLPFVGSSRDATGSSALFGYIFGNSSYTGGVATKQYYSSHSYQTYYIPSSLKEVIITDATNIGYGAFYGCSSLTSIEIPNSVTSIGERAFRECRSLTSIVIPNSVTSIGGWAFSLCNFLQYNEYGNCLYLGNKENPYLVLVKPVNKSITGVTIHNNTRLIMVEAFEYCISLTSIEIPNSVTSIGERAFYECSSLKSIEIPNSVTSIGEGAFEYCISLTSIEIPNSVTSIGSYAFDECSSLTTIVIPNSVTSIGSYAFSDCSSLTSIVIPNSVTSIGDWAFSDCSSLTSIVIPNSVTSIGSYAFDECSSLTTIVIPNSVTSIGDWAFSGCSSLTSIVIPNSVTSIGSYAFSWCSSLTSIEIPNSVTSIGYKAFIGCSSLTSIEIPSSVTSIGYKAFIGCSSLTIYCEASSEPSGWSSDWNFSNIPVIWDYKNHN